MEQGNQALRADVTAERFLSDMRALRTAAGFDHGQLAARAHYPRHVIAAAEAGPYLPALPVLAAYVRGCGGTSDQILAWEDRWRTVTGTKAHPLLSARVAGLSGAKRPPSRENSDPMAIESALRRFGNRMSQPGPEPQPGTPRETAPPPGTVPAAPVAPEAHAAPVAPVTPAAPAAPASSAAPAAPPQPGQRQHSQHAQGGGGGMSARTITIAAIVAALIILLIVILAL